MAKLSLPDLQSPHLRNDAPMLRIMQYAVFGFILLSSLTVFLGLRSYMSEYVVAYSPALRYLSYGGAYLFGALIPDFANATIIAWVVRSLLIRDYTDVPAKLILAAALVICLLLALYSYNMSQISAGALIEEIRGEEQQVNVEAIDSTMDTRILAIQTAAETEYQLVQQEYDSLITNTDRSFIARLRPFQLEIDRLEKNRLPANTQWTDRQINRQRRKIQAIEAERLQTRQRLTTEKNQALQVIRQQKSGREQAALASRDTTFSQQSSITQTTNERRTAVSRELKRWVSRISGFAVWVMLVLVAILQVLRVRNKQLPVYIPAHGLLAKIWEVIAALPHLGGTMLLNAARRKYQRAADIDLPPPPVPHRQWDYGTFRPTLLPFTTSTNQAGTLLPAPSSDPDEDGDNDQPNSILATLHDMLFQKSNENDQDYPAAPHDNTNRAAPLSEKTQALSDNIQPTSERVSTPIASDNGFSTAVSEKTTKSKRQPEKNPDNKNRAKNNTNRDQELEIVSEKRGEDGTIEKVKIGRSWYTRRQCSKKLSDARRGAERSATENARQRNLDRIETFERALRMFDEGRAKKKLLVS